ncbi:GNAT family N-acetyltransferase [Saccharothrix variisporea]|uniref:Acetyltransferase (GNAT) family protein n=1 Tax=Saccharothrix variisporea TaxID=543527 RepID=A0A495XJ45_9PSEU|nr:GNAT family N-acetyltransferase [Saccharothrix variisporea]RKT72784.1 acetyltransferase (GNAT) family protein [Saccharothrix variisporea]
MTSNPEEIHTDRPVHGRVGGPGELRVPTTVLSDPGTDHTPPGPPPTAEAAGPVARWKVHRAQDGVGYREVVPPETGEVIGSGGPHHHEPDGERTLPFHPSWPGGRGQAPETARAAVPGAERERPHRPVSTTTHPYDEPSQCVAEKLGSAHAGNSVTAADDRVTAAGNSVTAGDDSVTAGVRVPVRRRQEVVMTI